METQNLNKVTFVPVDLGKYIRKVLNLLEIKFKSSSAKIINSLSEEIVFPSNPAYIESILHNIIVNAIKYRHPDRYPVIEIKSSIEENEVVLKISDNGLGIDLEKHGHNLFEMYKTFHDHPEAQGIGLFITKYQVEVLDGRIEVESEVGKGTTFSIFFPLSEEALVKTE